VAASRRAAATRGSADASYERFLCVACPHYQLRILPYNRAVRDLNGLEREEFLRRVQARFSVTRSGGRVAPERRGVFGLYLPGQWYRLEIDAGRIPAADPTARLDISLTENLLAPVLATAIRARARDRPPAESAGRKNWSGASPADGRRSRYRPAWRPDGTPMGASCRPIHLARAQAADGWCRWCD
jgi:hypothetical protein